MKTNIIRAFFLAGALLFSAAALPQAAQADPAVRFATTKSAKFHNDYRARHGVPALKVDDALAKSAQEWADNGETRHSPRDWRNGAGENLFYTTERCREDHLEEAARLWYEEIYDYDYNHPDTVEGDDKEFAKGIGHFTQMIWKSSKKIGVGIANIDHGKWHCLVVAHYSPAGNLLGSFKENVPPPKEQPKVKHVARTWPGPVRQPS